MYPEMPPRGWFGELAWVTAGGLSGVRYDKATRSSFGQPPELLTLSVLDLKAGLLTAQTR